MAGIPPLGPWPPGNAGTLPYLLSVVVETWNEDPNRSIGLEASLAALARQTVPIERCEILVVVQPGSRGLADAVRRALPHARVLVPTSPLGYGQMKMRGTFAASCELVAHTDADCVVDPGWIEAALAGFREAPPAVAILQGLTRHAEGPGWQAATLQYCRSMWSPPRRGRYLILNNFAIRRALFERFPFADVPARQNVELPMVRRLFEAGYEIRIEPRMQATHSYRGGLSVWFNRGRAEAFDRLESLRLVYALLEPPDRMARQYHLRSRLRHHTRRCFNVLRDLVRCRRELAIGPGALLASGLAAVTMWAGACVGAWQADRRGSRPPTGF